MAFVAGGAAQVRVAGGRPGVCGRVRRANVVVVRAEEEGKAPAKFDSSVVTAEDSLPGSGLFDSDALGADILSSASTSFMTEIKAIDLPELDGPTNEPVQSRFDKFNNKKMETRDKFKLHENDSGSTEYQIAQLTVKIEHLTEHLDQHPKDFSSRRGLQMMVEKRKKLFRYLFKEDPSRCQNIIDSLGIRFNLEKLTLKNQRTKG